MPIHLDRLWPYASCLRARVQEQPRTTKEQPKNNQRTAKEQPKNSQRTAKEQPKNSQRTAKEQPIAALHHSRDAGPVTYNALRNQKTAWAGEWGREMNFTAPILDPPLPSLSAPPPPHAHTHTHSPRARHAALLPRSVRGRTRGNVT